MKRLKKIKNFWVLFTQLKDPNIPNWVSTFHFKNIMQRWGLISSQGKFSKFYLVNFLIRVLFYLAASPKQPLLSFVIQCCQNVIQNVLLTSFHSSIRVSILLKNSNHSIEIFIYFLMVENISTHLLLLFLCGLGNSTCLFIIILKYK